jgi:hypothetical protein
MKQTPREPDHDPKEPRNLSGVQFRFIHAGAPKQHPKIHTMYANDANGRYIGHLDWNKRSGQIDNINVIGRMQGLGVATSMYEKATKLAGDTGIKSPQHSTFRTDKGDAWARKVGGKVPPRKAEPEEEF